jgi:hypothetical protein
VAVSIAETEVVAIRAALIDADYPADKDALVHYAEKACAEPETVRALRAMPPVEYGNIDEVLRSADLKRTHQRG